MYAYPPKKSDGLVIFKKLLFTAAYVHDPVKERSKIR